MAYNHNVCFSTTIEKKDKSVQKERLSDCNKNLLYINFYCTFILDIIFLNQLSILYIVARMPISDRQYLDVDFICASFLEHVGKFCLESINILVDEQNGFRASRSCIDHLF